MDGSDPVLPSARREGPLCPKARVASARSSELWESKIWLICLGHRFESLMKRIAGVLGARNFNQRIVNEAVVPNHFVGRIERTRVFNTHRRFNGLPTSDQLKAFDYM